MKESSIEREIKENGRLTYTGKGVSMWPLIRQGKDIVVIEPVNGRLNKYDVALYKMSPESRRYILHRVLKVLPHEYVIRGDNCLRKEYGITDDMVVGVMRKLYRGGKEVNLHSFGYRFYVSFWRFIFPLRFVLSILRRAAGKVKRLLTGKRR